MGSEMCIRDRSIYERKNAINLCKIDEIARFTGKKEIDVLELGYSKVLGRGRLTLPLTIKANSFSKKALQKIEKAGGKALEV